MASKASTDVVEDVLAGLGVVLLEVGVAQWSIPAACVLGGVILLLPLGLAVWRRKGSR